MKKILLIAMILAVMSSCKKQGSVPETTALTVKFIAEQFVDNANDNVRTAFIDNKFQWTATDTVGIYPDTGSQIYFSMEDGAGTASATFDGGGWGFRSNAVYYSYYPFIADFYLDRHHIPVTFSGQVQKGASNLDHFGKFDYMYTPASIAEDGILLFSYKHLVSIIRVNAILPAGSYRQITITAPTAVFAKKGYFDLQSESPTIIAEESGRELTVTFSDPITVNGSTPFYAYLISNPVNLKNVEITVSAVDVNKKQFDCKKTPSSNYLPANLYGLGCSNWTEVPQTVGIAIADWGEGSSISGTAD